MAITINYVREHYPKEYGDLSDEQVQEVIDFFYTFGYTMVDHLTTSPKSNLNKERHLANKMPEKATLDQKTTRHIEHVAHCKCRPMPDSIKKEIQRRLG